MSLNDVLHFLAIFDLMCESGNFVLKSLFNYFIDRSPALMSPFLSKKHVFQGENHVFLTKNGLINSGLMSIKQSNKERQPLGLNLACLSLPSVSFSFNY